MLGERGVVRGNYPSYHFVLMMISKNACPKGMKNNNGVKNIFSKQTCINCGTVRGFWTRLISTDRCLCEECLHLLQRDSREACRQVMANHDKKAD